MPYKKLNIKNGQILNEDHLAHFEQGISDSTNKSERNISDINDLKTGAQKLNEKIYDITTRVSNLDNSVSDINQKLFDVTNYTGIQRVVNTVLEIKNIQPKVGDAIITKGYYNANDGGGAHYICKYLYNQEYYPWSIDLGETDDIEYKLLYRLDGTPEIDPDTKEYKLAKDSDGNPIPIYEDDGVTKKHKHLYACINETVVNYRMFGAKLDGKTDDYVALYNCHKYQHDNYTIEPLSGRKHYYIKVENHDGIINKNNNTPIACSGNIDLSGSKINLNNENSAWFGFYLWGDNDEDYMTYSPSENEKKKFQKDSFVINQKTVRPNSLIWLQEENYSIRDDAGYLYSNPRYELLLHTSNGLLANPFTEDWNTAGGLEVYATYTDTDTGLKKSKSLFTSLKSSYNRLSSTNYYFIGCDVNVNVSANKYSTVLWCKCHNAHISGFNFYPNINELHNTQFKNTMIYIWGAYNVEVSGITGFNSAGQKNGSENGTSGYVIRATNCLNLNIHDISVQGYWGATAMNCVKDVHFTRVNINRIDIHNYFYNLYIDQCTLFNHSVQIGEGRGICQITNSNFYTNTLDGDSYPSAHIVALNTTYGRMFEGKILIENCNVYLRDETLDEFDAITVDVSPDAISILDHYKFPECTIKGCYFYAYDPATYLVYFKIAGSRSCETSTIPPNSILNLCIDTGNDNTGVLKWEFIGYGIDWDETRETKSLDVKEGQIIRTYDTTESGTGTTIFYNVKYFIVTQSGTLPTPKSQNKPSDYSGNEFEIDNGDSNKQNPKIRCIQNGEWEASKSYNIGDFCYVENNLFTPVECYKCTSAGISNGYRPTHTSGIVVDGISSDLDACYWEYISPLNSFVTKNFSASMLVNTGDILYADGRLYEVYNSGTLNSIPPTNTTWDSTFYEGTALLKFIGMDWHYKSWRAKNSYCVSTDKNGIDSIYKLVTKDGITSGTPPVIGNGRVVDGDVIWRNDDSAISTKGEWKPETSYNIGDVVESNGHNYICVFDGKLEMPSQISLVDISTNMSVGGNIFSFYNTNIKTRLNSVGKWTVKIDNVDFYKIIEPEDGYFGNKDNPIPKIIETIVPEKTVIFLDKTITATGTDAWIDSNIFTIPEGMTKVKITISSKFSGGGSIKAVTKSDPWTTSDELYKINTKITESGISVVFGVSSGKIRPIFNLYEATDASNVFTIKVEGSTSINNLSSVADIPSYSN